MSGVIYSHNDYIIKINHLSIVQLNNFCDTDYDIL